MNPTLRIAFIAAVLATLAGCGNKGPLVMPPRPAPIDPATVPSSADAQAEQAAEDPMPTTGEESVPSPPPVEPPPADGTPEIPPATPAEDGGDGGR